MTVAKSKEAAKIAKRRARRARADAHEAAGTPREKTRDVTGKSRGLIDDIITEQTLEGLGKFFATKEEVAAAFHVTSATVDKFFLDNPHQKEAWERGRGKGKLGIRRAQIQRAMSGKSDTMLIWIGKQELKQSDKVDASLDNTGEMKVRVVGGLPDNEDQKDGSGTYEQSRPVDGDVGASSERIQALPNAGGAVTVVGGVLDDGGDD